MLDPKQPQSILYKGAAMVIGQEGLKREGWSPEHPARIGLAKLGSEKRR